MRLLAVSFWLLAFYSLIFSCDLSGHGRWLLVFSYWFLLPLKDQQPAISNPELINSK